MTSRDASVRPFSSSSSHRHRARLSSAGDSIHTVKPYFGLGVNSAFEDVVILDDCLTAAPHLRVKGGEWTLALPEFSRRRAADAKALVEISRGFDGGFLTFVLPLILDGVFNKLAPWLFMPNTIQMMQRPDWSFSRVAYRKRRDRAVQARFNFCCILTRRPVSTFDRAGPFQLTDERLYCIESPAVRDPRVRGGVGGVRAREGGDSVHVSARGAVGDGRRVTREDDAR